MADSIIRLKVESQEYDAKLKRASEGLTRYTDECRKVGGTLEVVEKDTLDYVRSLGRMDTASRTATGKLAEMRKAFVELSAQYKQMTDAEKASPFGKALAQSLSQLKTRIGESRSQLEGIKQEMNGGLSGALEAVASKFGLNVSQLTKFGGALAAAKGAMELAKGVIESTEAAHDAFAKSVEVSDNMTNQFLRSLATADFSNFINGMQDIIDKTIEAYEAMDEFESYAARFKPWQQAKESEIQTKLMQARAAKAQGDTKRAEQLTNEAKTLIDQLATSTKAYGEKQTKGGFSTIRSLMGQVDISNQQIAWYADPNNLDEATRKAEKFARLQEKIQRGNAMSGNAAQHEEARRAQQELDRDPSLRRAYTMMNLRDSDDSKQAQQFRRALGDIYGNTLAKSRIESLRARADRMDGVISGAGGRGGSTGTNPEKQGTARFVQAQRDYQQALEQAALEQKAGTLNKAEYTKKLLSAEETLWKSIGDAREVYDGKGFREAQDAAAQRVVELGGSVKLLEEEQRQAQEAAREQAAAQKKLAVAMEEAATALSANDLKGYIAAQGKTGGGSGGKFSADNFSGTTANIDAFAANLKEQLSNADVGSALFESLTAQLADATALGNVIQVAVKNGIDTAEINPQDLWSRVFGDNPGDYISDDTWTAIQDQINAKLKEMDIEPVKINFETGDIQEINKSGEKTKGTWKDAAGAVSQLSSALQGLEDPAAKVAGIVAQAIANIALTFASSLKGTVTPWDWIAASIAGTATMISTIAAIHSATGYAEGGQIPGNSLSGDNQLARVNAGEVILNRAQTSNIANALESPAQAAPASRSYVRGQDIYLAVNNYLKGSGRGQLALSH